MLMNTKILPFLLLFLAGQALAAETEKYWAQMIEAADRCYGGLSRTVEVATAAGIGLAGAAAGQYYTLVVPLYSLRERRGIAEKKRAFLEKGAEVLRELEEATQKERILSEEAKALESALVQEGLQGIEAYYKLLERVAEARAAKATARRKIEAFIRTCGEPSGERAEGD